MRLYILVLLLLMAIPQVHAEKPMAPVQLPGVTQLTAEEVISLILAQPHLVVIDARREQEYVKGHIEGAVNLVDTAMTPESLANYVPTHETPVLFYCNGERCLRSSNAAAKARQWDYHKIYWFRGGWAEWRNKRFPVAR